MTVKLQKATNAAVLSAFKRAAKDATSAHLLAAERSAGFIMPAEMPKGEGYQVLVKVVRFSEARLKDVPASCGLLDR